MTRSDLVEELAARFGQLTHRDAEFAVKTLLDAMSDALRLALDSLDAQGEGALVLLEGARAADREPALIVTFEKKASPSSRPVDLVLIPLEVFERLRGKR